MNKTVAAGVAPAPRTVRSPETTRARLLAAATEEFARLGLNGARVDRIAAKADVNKQLIYYYYGDKDGLYTAVLEAAYADIRAREQALDLAALAPRAAMEALVAFTFDYLVKNRGFVALLNDENVHRGAHLKNSALLGELRSPFVDLITETLERGAAAGVFRDNVDPAQFYVSLAGLCYFYHGNMHTLSMLFGRDLGASSALAERRKHVAEVVFGYLRPAAPASMNEE